jgi:hypothetical protein
LRGASALESVLREYPDPDLRVFVIWEPVLPTDWHAPGAGALARVPDARATQFWDPRHELSADIRRAAESDPPGVLGAQRLRARVVWDFVAIYPPGVRWDDRWPAARFAGAPVVRVIEGVRDALGIMAGQTTADRLKQR